MKPELQLLFEAHGVLDASIVVGETPTGLKRVVPILGGTFKGPQMAGTIVPGGADWQYVRADDVTVVEARYLLRTNDDVLIEVHNRGLRHGPAETMRRLAAGENVNPSRLLLPRNASTYGTRRPIRLAQSSPVRVQWRTFRHRDHTLGVSDSVKSGPGAPRFLLRWCPAPIEGIPGVATLANRSCDRSPSGH